MPLITRLQRVLGQPTSPSDVPATNDVLTFDGTNWIAQPSINFFYIDSAISSTSNSSLFGSVGTTLSLNATETLVDLAININFNVVRFQTIVVTNTRVNNSVQNFRDDANTVTGATLTVGGGATGEFDTGALSVAVASGSKCDTNFDQSAGGGGTLTASSYTECVRTS